ncbi:malolactic fermentation transcriptional regulator [Companilactobacillus tucceti DSM 20183]|uniref:Malolactic fermentation transcriptional regulator n=1 Tax=Companilactobacillus tucceti DSM 20183 TaxID=1423811 RepID=A0A0R1J953_9LACO|nr:LysR family transcriptional regulator [Companilactobacillus tucceti]KRK65459.1 malolactic fermentation transcriptional regulator [Companilactobacillus tucceti DSM 20183]
MNLNDYGYFQKLSEMKSFSETAHHFNVSQPTITYALKRLETEYDTKLVERKSYANSLSLTYAGEQLLKHVNKILHEDSLVKADLNRIKKKKIKMGLPPIITNYLVPKVFDNLKKFDYLNRIVPVVDGSKELLTKLKNGDIDLSLLGSTSLPEDPELEYKVLDIHQFKIIASSNRKFKNNLKLSDLIDEDFIILDEKSVHQQVFNDFIDKYNVSPNIIFQTSDYKLLLKLVQENKGISFITETAIRDTSGIQELKFDNLDLPPFYIMMIYRKNTVKSSIFQKLISIFENV